MILGSYPFRYILGEDGHLRALRNSGECPRHLHLTDEGRIVRLELYELHDPLVGNYLHESTAHDI